MTVELDERTGRLRLDAAAFETLVRACADEGLATSDDAAPLRAAGALTATGPHRALRTGLSAVLSPTCQLRVTVTGAETSALHQGWVTSTAAALLLEARPGVYDFVAVPPDFLPVSLARTLRLGPRRVGRREPRPLDGEVQAPAEGRWSWRAELVWPGRDGEPRGRALVGLDGPDGLWFHDEETGVLHPRTATDAWLLLTTLLPTDEELRL